MEHPFHPPWWPLTKSPTTAWSYSLNWSNYNQLKYSPPIDNPPVSPPRFTPSPHPKALPCYVEKLRGHFDGLRFLNNDPVWVAPCGHIDALVGCGEVESCRGDGWGGSIKDNVDFPFHILEFKALSVLIKKIWWMPHSWEESLKIDCSNGTASSVTLCSSSYLPSWGLHTDTSLQLTCSLGWWRQFKYITLHFLIILANNFAQFFIFQYLIEVFLPNHLYTYIIISCHWIE